MRPPAHGSATASGRLGHCRPPSRTESGLVDDRPRGVDHVAIGLGGAVAVAVYGCRLVGGPRVLPGAWVGGVVLVVVASLPWLERIAERRSRGTWCST